MARRQVQHLRERGADIILALTHLEVEDDIRLAVEVPEIDLIMGGHEHENIHIRRGTDFTPVLKADANARTVYIHRLSYDSEAKTLAVASHLQVIDARFEDDPRAAAVINRWVERAFDSLRRESGIDPRALVATPCVTLDGTDANIRSRETRLTQILAWGMVDLAEGVHASLYNSGSIRIDDKIPAGQTLTEYDILRILPFGNQIELVDMKGDLLNRVLNQSIANRGEGGFLHHANIGRDENERWTVAGESLESNQSYRIAMTEFLLSGKEQGLEFLTRSNPGLTLVEQVGSLRQALRQRLEKDFPLNPDRSGTCTEQPPVL